MREPEKILEQVSSWRPEALLAYERRRRANQPSPDAVAMAEAQRMWAAELEREREAAKGGRPPKDGKTLKGTGVIRLPKGRSSRAAKGGAATRAARAPVHGTRSSYEDRKCRCAECVEAYEGYRASRRVAALRADARKLQPAQHGTRMRYKKGCKCEPCLSVGRAYERQRLAKARRAGQAGERAA